VKESKTNVQVMIVVPVSVEHSTNRRGEREREREGKSERKGLMKRISHQPQPKLLSRFCSEWAVHRPPQTTS
jgi:hypothetical protein